MTHRKRLSVAVMPLALAACQSPTATATAGANTADASFITDVCQIIGFDRQKGWLAQVQSYLGDQIASHEEVVRSEDVMTRQEYGQPLIGVAHAAQGLIWRNLADLRALRQQMGTAR